MKKIFLVLVSIMMLAFTAVSYAAEVGSKIPTSDKITEVYTRVWSGVEGKNTKVGLVYANKAKTTYDDEIDYKILEAVIKQIKPNDHILVDSTKVLADLDAMGINDLAMAERTDLMDSLKNSNVDYAIIIQVDPFIRKERMAVMRRTIEMTSSIPVKIVDVQANRYLYNGKISEFDKHGTAVALVSNKTTVMRVLEKVEVQLAEIVNRIPKG